ncbi:MAG: glutamate--tRNA ligase [Eubacteriaceae bacterium]|nr:glutamate--tRNA ligase [Eubacteriaceae bacterium]
MVRVRFAPSPTGNVHVGSLRTALYNYLFAKKQKGDFLLRLEDTDRTRLHEGAADNLLKALYDTGVIPDEGLVLDEDGNQAQKGDVGPYIQSERLELYQHYIKQLLDDGKAYYCFCTKERLDDLREHQKAVGETPRYDGHCRDLSQEEIQRRIDAGEPYVIRLKLPENKEITFSDTVRGDVTINTADLDDQVLIKADGFPTYHFAVVVDDHLMGITHVIRGEEWLPSTPKHVYLYECFGWDAPQYVHLPNILNADHKKLSKRQGDVAVGDFLDKGYLPEALVNFLALLGWSPEDEREIMTLSEMVDAFDITKVHRSGAVFDREKLDWMNGQYIKAMDDEALAERIAPYFDDENIDHDTLVQYASLIKERIACLSQAPDSVKEILNGDFDWPAEGEAYDILHADTVPILYNALYEKLTGESDWNAENIQGHIKAIQKEHKKEGVKGKALYMPIRLMLTGVMHGPDLALIMSVLGKDECLKRLRRFHDEIL